MDNLYQDGPKCPQIENLAKITPKSAAEYVRFVAHVRHTQRRYFTFRKPEILDESRRLEKELDDLNAHLLDQTPKLFYLGGLKEISARAIKKYGKESQKRMAVEEAAELINALMKEARGRVTDADIITEIADVQIMMEQLSIIYGYEKVARERECKLERLVARMNNG